MDRIIEKIEGKLGDTIPSEIKEYLAERRPDDDGAYTYEDDSISLVVDKFFTFSNETDDLLSVYKDTKEALPPRTLPVARTLGGYILVHSQSQNDPAVYSWSHDSLPEYQTLKIANSFREFLEALEIDDE